MATVDMTALYREDATFDETVVAYQYLIDTGTAWRMEGHVGRTAMGLIEEGHCMLGEEAHTDYWGNRVPSRHEVQAGTKGSASFVEARAAMRCVACGKVQAECEVSCPGRLAGGWER